MGKILKQIIAFTIGATVFIGCGAGSESTLTPVEITDAIKDVYKEYFPIGAAVAGAEYGGQLFNEQYQDLLGHYNSLSAENSMKPALLQATEGNFTWEHADHLVDFAVTYNYKVRGHVLVWHSQTPSWMTAGTKTEARSRMENHISTVVERYKGKIYLWDVVNEAVSDDGSTTNGMRTDSAWYQVYGDDTFIQDAFDFAAIADPDAKLFYNDYSVVDSRKRTDIVSMINRLDLKSHGLDGIGVQAHWNLTYPTTEAIQTTIDTFYDMGLEVQITELDINCFGVEGNINNREFDEELATQLAARYKELFDLFRANSNKITSVTFWGVADDHTWLDHFYNNTYNSSPVRKNYPFVFDSDHNAKKAYSEIIDF